VPNLGEVPQVPILSTSPKLNPKLDLKSNHILKALTTMQKTSILMVIKMHHWSKCTIETDLQWKHTIEIDAFGIEFYANQGNVTINFQQLACRTLDCIDSVSKSNDNPMARSSSWQMKTIKKNKNWDDAFVKSTMESVEVCNSLQTIV